MVTASPTPGTGEVVERVVETVLPTRHGTFRMVGYLGYDGTEHVALSVGVHDDAVPDVPPLVRLHSECLTGDGLGSWRCDCGVQLDAALARIAGEGLGVLVYVRGHEGRGIGLLEKLKAYRLQDAGVDTVDANLALGHPSDARDYGQAAAILADLGLPRIRLMSSNPGKEEALAALGIQVVERTGMFVPEPPDSVFYLHTKRARMRHDAPPEASVWQELLDGRVPVSASSSEDLQLVERYGPLVAQPTAVVAQMAQSLDGFIATRSGDGAGLSGAADHEHLHRLRALVDAVVVGAGTVVADDPQLTVREVSGPHPTRVVLDPHARVPHDATVLVEATSPTLWLVGPDAQVPGVADHVTVLRLPTTDFAPAEVVATLRARGLGRVLVEGGGRTVSRFADAGELDRLYVTTVPVLLGDGVPGLRVQPASQIGDAPRHPSRRFVLGDDVCTELVMR
ncbi:GTP cyclohydrolase II [Arsenicicoccus sp. MKL-02]|uniref:GTP cyclohydrolase-2 n=1 Tax=Arsenicicoccus cauae TaxID=2663847 RepID=A0A6I3IEI9_9MICO|nr:GTP cyclohydrolase II [Arsenicicoccus cauae]